MDVKHANFSAEKNMKQHIILVHPGSFQDCIEQFTLKPQETKFLLFVERSTPFSLRQVAAATFAAAEGL